MGNPDIRFGDHVKFRYPVNGIDPDHTFRVIGTEYEFGGHILVLRIKDMATGMRMDSAGYFAWRVVKVFDV